MTLRNLLVALPGLLTPVNAPARTTTLDLSTIDLGELTTQGDVNPFSSAKSNGSAATLRDFYAQNDIDIETPLLPIAEEPTDPGDDDDDDGGNDGGNDGGTGGNDDDGPVVTLPGENETLTAEAGRVLTLDPAASDSGEISSIRILSQADHGHVSVNPDLTLAIVLSEDPANTASTSFRYEITYSDGSTREVDTTLDLTTGQEEKGWGQGEFYMLEEDAYGNAVVEHGENHRKVYVTEGDHGLTAAEIAKMEGLTADKITAAWLQKNPEYGATPDMALDSELGLELWYAITHVKQGATSNWLLFERGYDYGKTGRLINAAASGESELNPLFVGAYGEGAKPIIGSEISIYQRDSDHVVIQGLDAYGFMALQGNNILLDDMSFFGEMLNIQKVNKFTLRNSDIVDMIHDEPVNDGDTWHASLNRTGGVFIAGTDGALVEGNLFDHNGWADGYDYNLSADSPMPPSYYNHNLYMANNNSDVTVRDNIIMRGASFGAQVRSGGVIEDNVFIDNNAAVSALGGDYNNAGPIGNYTLFLDNLITSAGHKRVAAKEGALSMGIVEEARQTTLIGNIVAHLADPNNSTEVAEKTVTHKPLDIKHGAYFDDTIIYNWQAKKTGAQATNNQNVAGLDMATLDETTIQNFTAQLLGKETATIADLGNYLRAQADGALDHVVDADLINAFFREGFGLSTHLRAVETTLRFTPDDRADGMRWDNRLNWSTTDLPGTQDGDSVDLGGNRVLFGAQTVTIDDFIFGDFGEFRATSGRLNIAGSISVADTGALLEIDNAGQVWMAGYLDSDQLALDIQGGRFANTGAFAGGVDLTLGDNGQALLAVAGAAFDLQDGSSLTITGAKAKAGFDGGNGDSAVLRLHEGAALSFVAGETGFGKLAEFYSGAYESSDVTSGIRLDGDLSIDLAGWTATAAAQTWVLLDADQLIGSFDSLSITGMDSDRDALLRVDYVSDTVTLVLSADGTGTGRVRMVEAGEADFIDYTKDAALKSLWADLHLDAPEVSDLPI